VALVSVAGVGWSLITIDGKLHHEAQRAAPAVVSAAQGTPTPRRHEGLGNAARGAASRSTPASSAGSDEGPRRRFAPLLIHAPWERTVALASFCVIALVLLAGFYRFAVEHPAGVKRRAWPGTFVAFCAWLLVSWAFGAYVSSLGKYTLFYGSV